MRSKIIPLLVVATFATTALTSCAGATTSSALDPSADVTKQTLVVSNWAGYYPEGLAADFEAATGIKITIVNHATNEEIMGKLTTGADSGIDVAFVSGQYAQALNEAGLLQPMEKSMIPNEKNLYTEATTLSYDMGNNYSIPYAWGTTGLCYRSDLMPTAPTSWNDLLNPAPELVGKTTMLSTERWMALPALKAMGMSVNSTNPDDLAKVKTQLLTTKKTLLAFDDTTFYSKLISGESVMAEAWDGWCNYGIAEDPNIKFVVPSEGSDLWVDTMTVLKSSQNKEAAMAFVNYILEAKTQAWVAENILYKVPNEAAMKLVDPAVLASYPNLTMTPAELLKQETVIDLGEFSPQYTKLATEVMAG
ncbi:spermidine/putrescine ABC transporter substrate-binding protein [Alpinimonas psychrophila]|uniref:Spermidine/putrescine transport system substrate-binding protein n=1 Tax=Alpinimonas psychrophila TaxID=748908 RepID=A0A7W3JRM0_9MICO|nr:spermidine/putrescine ABC transporter substrate-binding protein [Alpinimonas psychrophila]MBA8827950.1 spermidine/putrescine transport system substrate-binding protein [Alpinimonas psychrophila]